MQVRTIWRMGNQIQILVCENIKEIKACKGGILLINQKKNLKKIGILHLVCVGEEEVCVL